MEVARARSGVGEAVGAIWLLAVAGLLFYGWISHERMSERELMFYATAFFWLFGIGFLLAHWYGDTWKVVPLSFCR